MANKKKSEPALLYLSKYYHRKIKLEELAKHAGVSPFHFHRIFVEENGSTPQQYLENIRMNHATHRFILTIAKVTSIVLNRGNKPCL